MIKIINIRCRFINFQLYYYIRQNSFLKSILTYCSILLLTLLVSTKPLFSLVGKSKLFSVCYLVESESEEDSKSKVIEEESDKLMYSQSFSATDFTSIEQSEKIITMTFYILGKIDFPFIQNVLLPPEL